MRPEVCHLVYFRTHNRFRLVARVPPLEQTPSLDHYSPTHILHPTSQSDGSPYPYLAAARHGDLLTLVALEGLGCPAGWGQLWARFQERVPPGSEEAHLHAEPSAWLQQRLEGAQEQRQGQEA